MYVRVARLLRANKVAKADSGEADEGEVQRVEIIPVLQRRVKCSGTTGDDAGGDGQVEHDPVHARLPLVQVHMIVVIKDVRSGRSLDARRFGDPPGCQGGPAETSSQSTYVPATQDPRQEGDDPLQEEIEEQDATGTTEEAIKNDSRFTRRCLGRGAAVACKISVTLNSFISELYYTATYACIEIGDQRTASRVDKCETRSRDISIPEFTGGTFCMHTPADDPYPLT